MGMKPCEECCLHHNKVNQQILERYGTFYIQLKSLNFSFCQLCFLSEVTIKICIFLANSVCGQLQSVCVGNWRGQPEFLHMIKLDRLPAVDPVNQYWKTLKQICSTNTNKRMMSI